MESPHLYENIEYNKANVNMKNKNYPDIPDYELDNLSNNEISMNLHNLISDPQHTMSDQHSLVQESLCHDLAHLNVDKMPYQRGMGANPGMNCLPPVSTNNDIYNSLSYVPQPVHSTSQYDHDQQYQNERLPIKEEPREGSHPDNQREFPACARMNYPGYNGYSLTPTVVPGADQGLLKSPHKSPTGLLKGSPKKSGPNDEYRRRRERNNIAVRKSREKAKARTRETEEKVKMLVDENRSLADKCSTLQGEITFLKSVLTSVQLDCCPEPFQTEIRNMIEQLNINHPHPHPHRQHMPFET